MKSLVTIRERSAVGRRLDGIHRFEGHLPVSCDLGGTPEVPKVYVEEHMYEFQCRPFGLSNTPQSFYQVAEPMLAHQAVWLIMYLGDMLLMAQSQEEVKKQLQLVISLLELLGFVIN